MTTEQGPRIDSLMAADHAEAINGKLYVMGGGFDTMAAPDFPHPVRFKFAALLRVPWGDTNRRLPMTAWAETASGEALGWRLEGELEAGRPAGKRGEDVMIAIAGPVEFELSEPGSVVLRFQFMNDDRSVTLTVERAMFVPNSSRPDA